MDDGGPEARVTTIDSDDGTTSEVLRQLKLFCRCLIAFQLQWTMQFRELECLRVILLMSLASFLGFGRKYQFNDNSMLKIL